jgi:hypothetical protein
MQYSTPQLRPLGAVSELTLGGGGSLLDAESKNPVNNYDGNPQPGNQH